MQQAARKRNYLINSDEGVKVEEALRLMETDSAFNTAASYSSNEILYSDHLITFTKKHMAYLNNNPQVDPQHYIANLRLMTKIRT